MFSIKYDFANQLHLNMRIKLYLIPKFQMVFAATSRLRVLYTMFSMFEFLSHLRRRNPLKINSMTLAANILLHCD